MTYQAARMPLAILFMTVGLLLGGCEALQGGPETSDSSLMIMTEDEVAEAMINEAGIVLVDVRREDAFASGHLPGAVNLPIERIGFDDPELLDRSRIIVYGQNFQSKLPTAAAKKMMRLGYENVYEFRGGVELWEQSGRSLTSGEAVE